MANRIPGGPRPPVTPLDKADSTESTEPSEKKPTETNEGVPTAPPPPADGLFATTLPKKTPPHSTVAPPPPKTNPDAAPPAAPSALSKVSPELENLDTESFLLSNLSLDKSDDTGPSFEMSPTAPAVARGVEISAEPTAAMKITEGETFGDPFDSRWEIIHPSGLAGLTPRSPDEAFDGPPLKGNPVRLRFRVKEPAPGRTFNVRVPGPEVSLRDAMKAQCKNAAKIMFLLNQGGLGRFQKIELHPDGNMNVLKPQFKENQDMHVAFGETTAKELEFTSTNETLLHRSDGTTDKSQANFFRERDFDPRIRDTPSKGQPSFDEAEALAKSIRKACGQKRLELRDNDDPVAAEKTAADEATRAHLKKDVAGFTDLPSLQSPYHEPLARLKEALSPEDPKLASCTEACDNSDIDLGQLGEKIEQHKEDYARLQKEAGKDDTDLETLSDHVHQHQQEQNSLALQVENFNGDAQKLVKLIEDTISEAQKAKDTAQAEALDLARTTLNTDISTTTAKDTAPTEFEKSWQALIGLPGEGKNNALKTQVEALRANKSDLHDATATLQQRQSDLTEQVNAAENQEQVDEARGINETLGIEVQQHNDAVQAFDADASKLNEDIKSAIAVTQAAIDITKQATEAASAKALKTAKEDLNKAVETTTLAPLDSSDVENTYQDLVQLGDKDAVEAFVEDVASLQKERESLENENASLGDRQAQVLENIASAENQDQFNQARDITDTLTQDVKTHNDGVSDHNAKDVKLNEALKSAISSVKEAQETALAEALDLARTTLNTDISTTTAKDTAPTEFEKSWQALIALPEEGKNNALKTQVEALRANKSDLHDATATLQQRQSDLTEQVNAAENQEQVDEARGINETLGIEVQQHNDAVQAFDADASKLNEDIKSAIAVTQAAIAITKQATEAASAKALKTAKEDLNKAVETTTLAPLDSSDVENTYQHLVQLGDTAAVEAFVEDVASLQKERESLENENASLGDRQAQVLENIGSAENQDQFNQARDITDTLTQDVKTHNDGVSDHNAKDVKLNEALKSAISSVKEAQETALAEALDLARTTLNTDISKASPNDPTDTEFATIYQALVNLGDEDAVNTFGAQVEALNNQRTTLGEAKTVLAGRQSALTGQVNDATDSTQVESVGTLATALVEEVGEHNAAVKDFDTSASEFTTKLENWWGDVQSRQEIAQAEALSQNKAALHVDKTSIHKLPPSGYEAAFEELTKSGVLTDLGSQVDALNTQKKALLEALDSHESSADRLTQKIDDAADQDSLNNLQGEIGQWKNDVSAHNTAVKKFILEAVNLTQAIRDAIPAEALEGLSAKLKLARLCAPHLTKDETAQLQGLLKQSPSDLSPEECEQGLAYLEILSRKPGPEGQLSESQHSWLYEHYQNDPEGLEENQLFGDIVTQISRAPDSPPAFSTLLGFVNARGSDRPRTFAEASDAFKALYEPALDGPPKEWEDQKLSKAMKQLKTKPGNTAALTDALELLIQPRGHYNNVTAASYGKNSPYLPFSDFAGNIEKKTIAINAKSSPSSSEKYFLQLARLFQQKMDQNTRGESAPWSPAKNDFSTAGAKLQFFRPLPQEGRNPFELLLNHIGDSSSIAPPSLETSTFISIPDGVSPNKSLEIHSSSDLDRVLSDNKAMGLQLRDALPDDFGTIAPTEIMNTIINTESASIKLSPQEKVTLLSDYVYPWLATDIQSQKLMTDTDITRFSSPGSSNDFKKLVGQDPEFALEILKFMNDEKVVFNAAQMQALKAMHKSKVQRVTTKIHMGAGEGKTYLAKVYAALVNTDRLRVLTHGGPTFHLAPFEQQEEGWKTITDEELARISTDDLVDLMSLEKDLAVTAKGMHKILDRFTPPSVDELPDFLQNSQYFIDEYDNDEYITDHGNLIARLRARGAKSGVHMSATRNDKEVLRRLEIKRKTLGQIFGLTPEEMLLPRKELEDLTTARKSSLSPEQLLKVDTLFEQVTSLEGTIAENSRDKVLNQRLKNMQLETMPPRDSAVATLKMCSQQALTAAGTAPGNILLELPDISIATSSSTSTLTTDEIKQVLTPQLSTLGDTTTLLIRVPGGALRQFDFSPPSQWTESAYNQKDVTSKRTLCLYHKDSVGGDFNAFSASNCLSHTIAYEQERSANELYQNLRRYRGNDAPKTTVLVSQSLGDKIQTRSAGTGMEADIEALRSMAHERNEELFLQAEYADSKDKIGRKCSKIIQTEAGTALNAIRKNVKTLKPSVERLQNWMEDRWALNFKSLTPQDKVLLKNICDATNCYLPGKDRSIDWLIWAKNSYDSPRIRIDNDSPWQKIKLALDPIEMMIGDFDTIIDEETTRINSMVTDEMIDEALTSENPQAHMDAVIQEAIDSTLETVPDFLARSLVKSISKSAPGRLKRDDYHRAKLDYYIHKHSLYKEQIAGRSPLEPKESAAVSNAGQDIAAQPPGDKVVAAAESLKGKLQWTLQAMNEKGRKNDFEEFVKRGKELGDNSTINCWEAVIFSAIKADVLKPEVVRDAFRSNMEVDFTYNKQIEDWLGDPDALTPYPGDTEPQPGDIITFYGMSHVALSLGGDRVMSLWNQPNDDSTFQETTIGELTKLVEENEELLLESLKTATGTYRGDGNATAMYDAVNDFKDLRDDDEATDEQVAKAKAHMLETVGSELGVQTLASPWERLGQLAKEAKDY